MAVKVIFSPVFRTQLHRPGCSMILEKEQMNMLALLQQLSRETGGQVDALLFEKNRDMVSAGLLVLVNDRTYTGTALNQQRVPLADNDVVSLLYYISGG